MANPDEGPAIRRAEELARRPLVMAALEGAQVLADRRFAPGATVTVGSNSRNGLVIPARFELTTYTLITGGALLHLAPPLFVQATVWLDGAPVELKGHVRDLRGAHPGLAQPVPLASERFLIRYVSGIALLGRFAPEGEGA